MPQILLGLLVLVLLFSPVPLSRAQEATSLPSLPDLKIQYRASLDAYRTKEELFSIAAQQYYTLKTLASGEEAVRAAREVNLARVDTVLIYIQNLRTTLDTNNGIELSRGESLQKQFDLLVEALKRHRSRVEIATTRQLIEQENLYLESLQESIEALCYEALSLIKIGSIQAALDQLIVTKDELDKYILEAKTSETVRSEKQRGAEEITRSIDSIKTNINLALESYDKELENADLSLFQKVQELLEPGFAGLTQALEFVRELAK